MNTLSFERIHANADTVDEFLTLMDFMLDDLLRLGAEKLELQVSYDNLIYAMYGCEQLGHSEFSISMIESTQASDHEIITITAIRRIYSHRKSE